MRHHPLLLVTAAIVAGTLPGEPRPPTGCPNSRGLLLVTQGRPPRPGQAARTSRRRSSAVVQVSPGYRSTSRERRCPAPLDMSTM